MNRFVLYGIATFLFVGGLAASFDRSQINRLREAAGFDPLYRSEAIGIQEADAAVAQIAALPAPGILDEPPTLGRLANEAVRCTDEGRRRPLPPTSAEAVRRYLLALAATGLEREHPLVEPRLVRLYALVGQGPMAALEIAAEGRLIDAERTLLSEFHATYRDPDHPLYAGLQLYGGTMEGMSFQTAADWIAGNWERVGECVTAATLPPLAAWERLAVE